MPGKSKRPIKPASAFGRETCHSCFRASRLCICSSITQFEIEPLVVLVVHPREFMKTVGTVRIVKRSLTNSILWRGNGFEFDEDAQMLRLLADPTLYPMVLFPGSESLNLTAANTEEIAEKIPTGKRLAIFVIDGTWTTAKQMIRQSQRLSQLPKISFNVDARSIYEFRKQPKEFCLSTVEAVAVLVENLVQKGLCQAYPENSHHQMLNAFRSLVRSQVQYESLKPNRLNPNR
jgi:DTW domain-containing protein YfiP